MKYTKKLFSIFCIIVVSWMAVDFSYAQSVNVRTARVLARTENKVLFITQSVNTNFQASSKGLVGSPSSSVSSPNFSMGSNAKPLTDSERNTLVLLPVDANYRNATSSAALKTAQQVQDAAQQWVNNNVGNLTNRFRTVYMPQFGVGSAWFNYSQEVNVVDNLTGTYRTVTLFWSLSLDLKGQPMYTKVQLLEKSPRILQAHYIPKNVAQGFPNDWQEGFVSRSKPGYLRYRFLDLQGQPVQSVLTDVVNGMRDPGGWISVNYEGLFDELPDSETIAVDPDASLKCLINQTPEPIGSPPYTCAPGMKAKKDIKTLIADYGVSVAYLKYSRKIEPVYDAVAVPGTNPVEYTGVAKISLQIDTRTVSRGGDCDNLNYRNTGTYGYTVVDKADIYLVQPGGGYQTLGPVPDVKMALPAGKYQPYDVTRFVTQNQYDSGVLGNLIVDPYNPPGAMLSIPELQANPNVVGKPGLIMGPSSAVAFMPGNSFVANIGLGQADMAVNYNAIPNMPGWSQLTFGTIGDNYWNGPTSTGAVFDRSFTFNLSKSHIKQFFIDSFHMDDYLAVKVNGTLVGVFPYGGDRLEQVCTNRIRRGRVVGQDCRIQFGENWFRAAENGGRDGDRSGMNLNIHPYLKDGANTIMTRTVVAGGGESFLSMKIEACN